MSRQFSKIKKVSLAIILAAGFLFLRQNGALAATTPAYQASRIEQSFPGIINLAPGKAFTFWVKFKNTGTETWTNNGKNAVRLKAANYADGGKSVFYHPFWKGPYEPAKLAEAAVRPGETGLLRFAVQGAEKEGFYWANFDLMAGEEKVKNTYLEIAIRVINDHPATAAEQIAASQKPSLSQPTTASAETLELQEPLIRIGLYNTAAPVRIAASGSYSVKDKENKVLIRQTGGEESEAVFDLASQKYFLSVGGKRILMTDSYLKFVPATGDVIMQITNYENRPAWNQNLNDNKFRGNIEVRYNPNDKKTWVIEELPMESYLKGMAEASNDSPLEHLKAMSIAERTYAFYHYRNPYKHADQDFLLTPTDGDQVYRGYGTEQRLNNIVTAATATQGLVVTYGGEIVNTPYFTRSDGRTKAWSEVWSGEKPYLISKPDPDCARMTLLGHGVGLSAAGAKARAERGAKYDEILKYYYTGIEIQKAY